MKANWTVGAVVALITCLAIGAAGGLNAAGDVDQFYVATRAHAKRPAPVVESAAADWNQSPPQPTSIPASGMVWIGGGSTDPRGDGSDLTEIDRVVEQAAAVRVHRGRREPRHPIDDATSEPVPASDPTPPTT